MGGASILRQRADLTAVVDACYAAASDHDAWARDVVGSLTDAIDGPSRVGLVAIEHAPDCRSGAMIASVPERGFGSFTPEQLWPGIGPEAFRRYFYPSDIVTSHSAIETHVPEAARKIVSAHRREIAATDMFGMVVHPEPGVAVVLFATLPRKHVAPFKERRRLLQIALHLESGFRMRRRGLRVRAVLGTDGTLVEGEASGRAPHLQESARKVDAARSARDLDPWSALVRGELSVVPRMRGSRRVYELVENACSSRPFRALTKREVDVLSVASRGVPAKLCGYSLGISDGAVSRTLASAATKVGATSRLELIRVAAMLGNHPLAHADDAELTTAETEILALLQQGLSNAAIAARRARSVHTIANQVAALLRKTNAPSRRAIVAR